MYILYYTSTNRIKLCEIQRRYRVKNKDYHNYFINYDSRYTSIMIPNNNFVALAFYCHLFIRLFACATTNLYSMPNVDLNIIPAPCELNNRSHTLFFG